VLPATKPDKKRGLATLVQMEKIAIQPELSNEAPQTRMDIG
jgi:hypothetical protein